MISFFMVCTFRCIQSQFEHQAIPSMGHSGATGLRPSVVAPLATLQQPHSINIAQQQEDLLTQSNPAVPANLTQAQPRPTWAVTTSTSPIGILTPTPHSGNNSQNWINSRPNSSSIHTPSPTSLQPLGLAQAAPGTAAPVTSNGASQQGPMPPLPPARLPPPLAPLTTTNQPPSSLPPPAYTPPTHLSGSGFPSSPHSSS
jgi:hypothetical protein